MARIKDMTDMVFGKLTVLSMAEDIKGKSACLCLCKCGVTKVIRSSALIQGRTITCATCVKGNDHVVDNEAGIVHFKLLNNAYFTVDLVDYDMVIKHTWSANKEHHVYYKLQNRHVLLHRLILGAAKGMDVDHIDGNPLNNRRSNLREVTHQQNMFNQKIRSTNTSGVTGVYKQGTKWRAQIMVSGKCMYLGSSADKDTAVTLRKQGEEKYFGEYARKESDYYI